jgi:hypothetical protein
MLCYAMIQLQNSLRTHAASRAGSLVTEDEIKLPDRQINFPHSHLPHYNPSGKGEGPSILFGAFDKLLVLKIAHADRREPGVW